MRVLSRLSYVFLGKKMAYRLELPVGLQITDDIRKKLYGDSGNYEELDDAECGEERQDGSL